MKKSRASEHRSGLPANVEMERYVLGAILLAGARYAEVEACKLTADDFSLERHRRIWRAVCGLHGEGKHVDAATIAEELHTRGELDSVGGTTYLVELDNGLPHLYDLASYVRILQNKATLRRAMFAAEALLNRCKLSDATPDSLLPELQSLLSDIEERRSTARGITSIEQVPAPETCGSGDVVWVHEPELAEGTVAALTGGAESGKSHIAMMHCRAAMAAGRHALILDRESPLHTALDRMQRLGVTSGPLLHYCGGWLGEVPDLDSTVVTQWVRRTKPSPLIVVDSLSAFHGGDQNDAGQMRAFMDKCRRLADPGAAVLVLHHDGKSDSSKIYRGSSDFAPALDQGFHVTNFNPDGSRLLHTLTLECFKSRYGFSGKLVYKYAIGKMIREESQAATSPTVTEQLTVLLRANPGIKQREFEDKAGGRKLGRNQARQFLDAGVRQGTIVKKPGAKNANLYSLVEDAESAEATQF